MRSPRRTGALAMVVALMLSACAGGAAPSTAPTAEGAAPAGETTTVSLWIFEGEETFLPKLKESFEAAHPNITLEITEIPEDQYVTKIDTALAAGETPDIGYIYELRWLKAAKFLPIDDMLRDKGIEAKDYNQGALTGCMYDGKIYCLGSYTGAVLLFYNKNLFDQAGVPYPSSTVPMTLDEYAALAKQLTKNPDNIETKVWGGASSTTHWWMDRANLFSPDGRTIAGLANDPSTVHAYEVLAAMVTDGSAPSSSEMQLMGDADILAQGRQAMTITDNLVAIRALEAANIPYGAAPPPVEQRGDPPYIPTWTDAFGVFSDSKQASAAMEVVAFLATEGNRLRLETEQAMPLNMKVATEQNWAGENAGRQSALEATMLARPGIFVPAFWDVTAPLEDAYNQILEGVEPQAALDEAAPVMQDNLEKAWETWDQIR
jgi:multiple sugar transport system substrate-binding protein